MLDPSRRFITADYIKQHIDRMALYKLNRLHLHLSDDQGWRLEIKSRPRLTTFGSSTQVGGGKSGYYTQDEMKEIIAYAQDRHIVIVPEFDMPGHTQAALRPILNWHAQAPTPDCIRASRSASVPCAFQNPRWNGSSVT